MQITGTVIIIAIALFCLLFLAGLTTYLVGLYNSLVQVSNNIEKAWANIDVLLMQRHDELGKLLDTCKGYMKHESEALTEIAKLRSGYSDAKSVDEKVEIENRLNHGIGKLRVTWENYPDLKANETFQHLMKRISGVESNIADRREFFNESVNIYNIQIERFPQVFFAPILGYKRRAFLEAPEEKKEDVKMDFSS
jgi:LemA protein